MTDEAFRRAVLRALYVIMLGVIGDKRCDLEMVLDWRKDVLKNGGPEPFYRN